MGISEHTKLIHIYRRIPFSHRKKEGQCRVDLTHNDPIVEPPRPDPEPATLALMADDEAWAL